MSAHTPGPWVFEHDEDDDKFVVWLDPNHGYYQSQRAPIEREAWFLRDDQRAEAEANARLIAAAPELLAALIDVLAYVGFATAENQPAEGALANARAAIEKARGEDGAS